jgi:8-hydroxy-5-deazaflavin:NADPH oxidoreductase
MDIGIVGAGHMGRALARHLAVAGHDVRLANSRGPGSLADVVADIGHGAQADTIVDTVAFAEVVFFAVPFEAVDEIAREAEPWDDKIVVDVSNARAEESSSAAVASLLPGARVVKAFNTIFYRRLEEEGQLSEANRLAVFYATDDDEAGEIVARLIGETGFAAVRTGSLDEGGRRQQPGGDLFDVPLTRAQAESRLRG